MARILMALLQLYMNLKYFVKSWAKKLIQYSIVGIPKQRFVDPTEFV